MCLLTTAKALKPGPKRSLDRIMDRKGIVEAATQTATVKKQGQGAEASSPKTGKAARRASRPSKSESGALVCRYCGSDDLAPSFKKRRDARCRACFKKRYSSNSRAKAKKAGKAKAKK
jgi:hypothetical protein